MMDAPFTLPFETFWAWLASHPNCILRAGSPEAVIYDDEDFHWHFASEPPRTLLVQVIRGKRLVGEILLDPEAVSYAQAVSSEQEGEHIFELISETPTDRTVAFFFVLTHGYEEAEATSHSRVH
jgi:hypothetical protein